MAMVWTISVSCLAGNFLLEAANRNTLIYMRNETIRYGP
jgi:hypothetical protein